MVEKRNKSENAKNKGFKVGLMNAWWALNAKQKKNRNSFVKKQEEK